MPRILAPLVMVVALGSVANAGIQITKPAAGFTAKGGSTLEVEWKEGGTGPALADFDTYTIELCAGTNDAVCDSTALRNRTMLIDNNASLFLWGPQLPPL